MLDFTLEGEAPIARHFMARAVLTLESCLGCIRCLSLEIDCWCRYKRGVEGGSFVSYHPAWAQSREAEADEACAVPCAVRRR